MASSFTLRNAFFKVFLKLYKVGSQPADISLDVKNNTGWKFLPWAYTSWYFRRIFNRGAYTRGGSIYNQYNKRKLLSADQNTFCFYLFLQIKR